MAKNNPTVQIHRRTEPEIVSSLTDMAIQPKISGMSERDVDIVRHKLQQNDDPVTITVRLPPRLHQVLKDEGEEMRMSVNRLIVEALTQQMARKIIDRR
jgi:hypothetical protein